MTPSWGTTAYSAPSSASATAIESPCRSRTRPWLFYLLDQLAAQGLRRVVLCTGYLHDHIEAAIGSRHAGLDVVFSREPSPLGTAGALRHALPLLRSADVLVLNGDSLIDTSFAELYQRHGARSASATLLLSLVEDASRYGAVELDAADRIVRFAEKGETGPGWVSAGVYLLRRALVNEIPTGSTVSLERDMFPRWIGPNMYGCRCARPFLDIGLPSSLAAARSVLAAR